jgi:hypothetical protein
MNKSFSHFKIMIALTLASGMCVFGSACAVAAEVAVAGDSCLSPGSAAKQINVKIDSETDLPYFDNKIDCGSGPAYPGAGSICLDVNVKPDMKFMLTGPGASDWEFVEFQLSGDGVNWPGTLPPGVYSDFQFDSDTGLQTGKPNVKKVGATMHVQNNNCHEFLVNYRIVLKNEDVPPLFVRLHPVMDNRGTN